VTENASVLPRLSALLLLVLLPACVEPRVGGDDPACSTEADCTKLYRASVRRLRICVEEHKRAGYVSPGGAPAPQNCDGVRAETERLADTVSRLRGRKQSEGVEQQGGGFEVPPIPSASASAAP
jgi:hypothetical protein